MEREGGQEERERGEGGKAGKGEEERWKEGERQKEPCKRI